MLITIEFLIPNVTGRREVVVSNRESLSDIVYLFDNNGYIYSVYEGGGTMKPEDYGFGFRPNWCCDGENIFKKENYNRFPLEHPHINKRGITVEELCSVVNALPKFKENGDPYEVWIGDEDGHSNQLKEIWALNRDNNGSDIILES